MEAEGDSFYYFDLVIDSFNEAGMDRIATMGQDAGEMVFKFSGEVFEGLDTGADSAAVPALKPLPRPGLALVEPKLLEVVLEDIDRVQPSVESEQIGKASRFVILGVEVLPVLEESRAFFVGEVKSKGVCP